MLLITNGTFVLRFTNGTFVLLITDGAFVLRDLELLQVSARLRTTLVDLFELFCIF